MTQATPKDYWISPSALHIELNALSDPDYIQASCVSGAQILVYVKDIIGYDAGHNYRRWPLQASPTVFNSHAEKYVYAAIPRDMTLAALAWIVFPSEVIDVYGKNEKEEQIGDEKYYYINLQGIITSSGDNGTVQREWKSRIATGYLSSDEAISAVGSETEWYNYSNVDGIVTLLKDLTMKEGTKFRTLFADFINVIPKGSLAFDGQGAVNGIANSQTPDTSTDKIVTPDFVSNRAISRLHNDTTEGLITFKKGLTAKEISDMENIIVDDATITNADISHAKIDRAELYDVISAVIFEQLATFMNGILVDKIESQSQQYDAGYNGFSLHKTENDRYRLEIDELLVRVKAIFNELEIRKLSYVGGNIEISPAGGTIYSTKPLTREDGTIYAYRCYMTADDGTTRTRNWWKVGDQAKCQTFNIDGEVVESDSLLGSDGELLSQGDSLIGYTRSGNASNRYYWRLVIGTGEAILEDGKTYNYVDLSDEKNVTLEVDGVTYTLEGMDSVFDGHDDDSGKWHDLFNDIPQKGDSIVMEGSQIDSEQPHVIRITSVGENAPAIEEFVGVGARTQKEDGTVIGPWNLLARRKTCIAPRTGDEFVAKKFSLQTDDGKIYQVPADLGEWTEGMLVGYYTRVSYQGSLWLCISKTGNKLLDGTIVEPSLSYPDIWVRQVAKGEKGDKGADGKQGEQGPQGEKGEDGAQGADGITISLDPSTIIIEQKSDSSGFVFPPASSITIMQGNTNITNRIASVNVGTCSGCRADVNKSTGDYKVLITALIGEPKTGYAQFNIVFTDINGKTTTRTATINFAVNYLGKFKSTIDADVEKKIAEKTSYYVDGVDIGIQQAVTNVITSSEGITQQVSSIQGTLDAAGNLTNIREDVTSIQQQADSIETSVASLGGEVANISNIAQTANSISMSVGNANRNLLSDSYLNLVLKKGSYHVGQVYLTAGKNYTLSSNGKVNTDETSMVVSVVGSNGNSNSVTISEKATTTKSVSFICQASGLYDVTISGTYGTDANSRMICYYVQLEEGETATSYSRSKTDTISHINMLPDMKYLSNGYMLDDELVEVDGVKCKSITKSTTGGGDVVRHNITLDSNTLYTFSFMAKVISNTGDGKITAYLADLGGKKVSVCQGNIIEHTDRVGLASDGYAPLETIKDGEWCRYIIHYMTDDLHDIQGTAKLLVRCPDGMQASFCALKFEKGGMASNYGTAEQKLSNTGIDISEGKIRLTAETTTIDGDLQLNGIITENTTDNLYTDPKEETDGRKLFCIDMKETKSCVVPYGSFVVLPAIEGVEPDTYWKNSIFAVTMPEYRTAGTKLSITAAWSQDVSAWNLLQRDGDGFIDVAYVEDPNYRDLVILQNKATILCADPRILNSKDFNFSLQESDDINPTTNFYPSGSDNHIVLVGNMHGRFVLNGCLSRFLAILPGQTARLKSQILYVKMGSTAGSILVTDYSDRNATQVLLWDVENANDFYPIDATISCNRYNQDTKGYDWTSWKFYGISKTGGSSGVSQNSLGNGEFVFGPDVLNVRNWKNYPSNSSPVHFELEYGISRDINDNQNT